MTDKYKVDQQISDYGDGGRVGYNVAQGLFAVANGLFAIADAIKEANPAPAPYNPYNVPGRFGNDSPGLK